METANSRFTNLDRYSRIRVGGRLSPEWNTSTLDDMADQIATRYGILDRKLSHAALQTIVLTTANAITMLDEAHRLVRLLGVPDTHAGHQTPRQRWEHLLRNLFPTSILLVDPYGSASPDLVNLPAGSDDDERVVRRLLTAAAAFLLAETTTLEDAIDLSQHWASPDQAGLNVGLDTAEKILSRPTRASRTLLDHAESGRWRDLLAAYAPQPRIPASPPHTPPEQKHRTTQVFVPHKRISPAPHLDLHPTQLYGRLATMLQKTGLAWSLGLTGEDQAGKTLAAHVAKLVRNGGGLLIMSTGSGKSLSFALALPLTDPGFKSGPRYPELADDKPVKAIPFTETIDIAVLAKKNITTDVTAALAEGLGITPAAASAGSCNPELIREHRTEYSQTRSGRWTVVIDGLDEARQSTPLVADLLFTSQRGQVTGVFREFRDLRDARSQLAPGESFTLVCGRTPASTGRSSAIPPTKCVSAGPCVVGRVVTGVDKKYAQSSLSPLWSL